MSIFAVLAEPLSCISLTIETLSVSNLCYLIGSLAEASKTKIASSSNQPQPDRIRVAELKKIFLFLFATLSAPFLLPVFFGSYNMISILCLDPETKSRFLRKGKPSHRWPSSGAPHSLPHCLPGSSLPQGLSLKQAQLFDSC